MGPRISQDSVTPGGRESIRAWSSAGRMETGNFYDRRSCSLYQIIVSVPRRFDRLKRSAVPPSEEGRASRRRRWTAPAAPPHGEPCASTQVRPRQRRPRGRGTRPDGAGAHTESARSSIVARCTCAIGDESRRPGSTARSASGRNRSRLASRLGTAPAARSKLREADAERPTRQFSILPSEFLPAPPLERPWPELAPERRGRSRSPAEGISTA